MAGTLAAECPDARPNILWITCEDIGPQLGCYGDAYATTPHLDRLAARGLTYTRAWSCAPVCAPARTTLISGLYPPSTGAEHMRSLVPLPSGFRFYPQTLRAAGYYCANNEKEDYNLESVGPVWDESSRRAHWTNRPPGQPFFAIFNHTVTHESQVRRRPHTPVHDPSRVRVPAYVALEALNALDQLGPKVRPVLPALRALPVTPSEGPARTRSYAPRLLEEILQRLVSS